MGLHEMRKTPPRRPCACLFVETASPDEIAQRFHSEVYVTGLDIAFWGLRRVSERGVPHPRRPRIHRGSTWRQPHRHAASHRRQTGRFRVPDHTELRIGALQWIIRQTEIPRARSRRNELTWHLADERRQGDLRGARSAPVHRAGRRGGDVFVLPSLRKSHEVRCDLRMSRKQVTGA
jgi:hypothetical protein